jgi:uncharacterized membrane-anchored protein YjiN (DUF445 family)
VKGRWTSGAPGASVGAPRRSRRSLALGVLLAAAGLAVVTFPFRATWWGGWLLAIAEAGVVGGLADWFAVTAIFRRPLGLPIPHTALIPANWELMASRVGTMVGDRVLTREYVTREIARLDIADLLARGALRITRADLDGATRAVLRWVAAEFPPSPRAGELVARLQRLLVKEPAAPLLAAALEAVRQRGWDRRMLGAAATALADALERPAFRRAVAEVIDDLLRQYRARIGLYPRLALGLADVFGLVDPERMVRALHAGLLEIARDPAHPLREQIAEWLGELGNRLRTDPALAARVEAVKEEVLGSDVVARVAEAAATALRRALLADLGGPRSEVAEWVADRLDRSRHALVEDAGLRRELDGWVKARAGELVERYHGRIATFIEQGVHALGAEGAVRLIEEHAGDDLQYIRVNGTVVGGLAGGAIYAVHLLLRLVG